MFIMSSMACILCKRLLFTDVVSILKLFDSMTQRSASGPHDQVCFQINFIFSVCITRRNVRVQSNLGNLPSLRSNILNVFCVFSDCNTRSSISAKMLCVFVSKSTTFFLDSRIVSADEVHILSALSSRVFTRSWCKSQFFHVSFSLRRVCLSYLIHKRI